LFQVSPGFVGGFFSPTGNPQGFSREIENPTVMLAVSKSNSNRFFIDGNWKLPTLSIYTQGAERVN
jgi:hypothetical protein